MNHFLSKAWPWMALVLGLLITPAVQADEVQIADGDTAALLAALAAAGQSGEPTTINLAVDGEYVLPDTGGRILLSGNVVIEGNGATITTVHDSGGESNTSSPLGVTEGATCEIRNLAWEGTYISGLWFTNHGSLALDNVTFSGVFMPSLSVYESPLGGGHTTGTLIQSEGESAFLKMENVTMDLELALYEGNHYPDDTTGIVLAIASPSRAELEHVTMRAVVDDAQFENRFVVIGVASGYEYPSPNIKLGNSILMIEDAVPSSEYFVMRSACTGSVSSLGGNVSSDDIPADVPTSCGIGTIVQFGHAGFGSFGDHGGPVPTLSLRGGSPAVNAGADAYCLPTDARGYLRGAECDAGAFELGAAIAGGGLGDKGSGGYWSAPDEDGFGFLAVSFPDSETALLVWSTFDASGHSTTVYGTGGFVDEDSIGVPQALIDLPVAGSDPVRSEAEAWGSLRLDLESCTDAHFSYQTSQPGFASGAMDVGRLSVFSSVGCSELAD